MMETKVRCERNTCYGSWNALPNAELVSAPDRQIFARLCSTLEDEVEHAALLINIITCIYMELSKVLIFVYMSTTLRKYDHIENQLNHLCKEAKF
jgi:hypothetical protein